MYHTGLQILQNTMLIFQRSIPLPLDGDSKLVGRVVFRYAPVKVVIKILDVAKSSEASAWGLTTRLCYQ